MIHLLEQPKGTTLSKVDRSLGLGMGSSAQFLASWTCKATGPLGRALVRLKELFDGLDEVDIVPCERCGLRGHLAGDADRCIGLHSAGLGQSPWMTGEGV